MSLRVSSPFEPIESESVEKEERGDLILSTRGEESGDLKTFSAA